MQIPGLSLRAISIALLAATVACSDEKAQTRNRLIKFGKLPAQIVESSGLAHRSSTGTLLTHSDSGAKPELFEVREDGQLVRRWEIPGVRHRDWEAITVDDRGQVYICDSGNNASERRNLMIYRFNFESAGQPGKIAFTYPDQHEFPPTNPKQCFDVEACVWRDKHLYLFTKDRIRSRTSRVYRLKADGPEQQTAELLGELAIDGQVTDAALSLKGDRLVLLSYQKLFVARLKDGDILGARFEMHKLDRAGQTEAVTFIDDHRVLITNEAGQLYSYELP